MIIERKANNTFWITERTPSSKDFKRKAEKLLKELREYKKLKHRDRL